MVTRVLLLSNRKISESLIRGEDFYVRELMDILAKRGCHITEAYVEDDRLFHIDKHIVSMAKNKYDVIHLHQMRLLTHAPLFKKFGSKVFAHVYYIWHAVTGPTNNLARFVSYFLSQRHVDKFVVTSPAMVREMKSIGVSPHKLFVLEPYYHCSSCHLENNIKEMDKRIDLCDEIIRLLYIGPYVSFRIPLSEILAAMRKLDRRYRIQLTIVSFGLPIELVNRTIDVSKNVSIEFLNKILSNVEKCELYRRSHFFIFIPKSNVAMCPPLTVLEAVYHGVVPLISQSVKKYLAIPDVNVVNSANSLAEKIGDVRRMLTEGTYSSEGLVNSFTKFYDFQLFASKIDELYQLFM